MPAKKIQAGEENTVPAQGLGLRPVYAHRNMKMYGINMNEMNGLSTATTRLSIEFGLATSMFSFSLTCFLEGQFTEVHSLSPAAALIYVYGTTLFLGLGLIFLWRASIEYRAKDKILKTIIEESAS